LREALNNAAVHGNHEDPTKCVGVKCRCESGDISIEIRDGGIGFDVERVPDPTVSENIRATHGRGIYLMKALMDEVRFEEGGSLVRMRKRAIPTEGSNARSEPL
jgi:serine/threonine-protein kinase RsbW